VDGKVCDYQDSVIGFNCLAPPPAPGGFGYPVGDKTTFPAGGWTVTQVLGHYFNSGQFVGGHLAEDIALSEAQTANAPVYSVADGLVLYSGPNGSTYVNVILIEHTLPDGSQVCSFYGHIGTLAVQSGSSVTRGQQIGTVLDWQAKFGAANSHLHYVILSHDLCLASDAANGALICGYDDTSGPNGITDLSNEPFSYTSVGDVCGDYNYPDSFISPAQFIQANHF
jgi:murein DD-endopeptidase MepM/ murein hydrolase activator NlpD